MNYYFSLFKKAFSEWQQDRASVWSAALAYYSVFSLGPLLFVIISLMGVFLSRQTLEQNVYSQLNGLLGPSSANLVKGIVEHSQKPSTGIIGTSIGIVTLVLGAIGVFGQLKQMLNYVWGVKQSPRAGVFNLIRDRFLNISMLGVIAFLLLISLVASAALSTMATYFQGLLPLSPLLLEALNVVVSLVVISFLFAFIFKILPDVQLKWRDVWQGAVITAVFFVIGKTAIGLYIGNSGISSSYGAAASLIIILLWVYYSAQILIFGAEVTKVKTLEAGRKVKPNDFAVFVNETHQPDNIVVGFAVGFLEGMSKEIRQHLSARFQ